MLTATETTLHWTNPEDQHRLTPLLAPRSIALVGASTKLDVAGNDMVLQLLESGYQGRIYAVNPKYEEVEGVPCYPSLADLPEVECANSESQVLHGLFD